MAGSSRSSDSSPEEGIPASIYGLVALGLVIVFLAIGPTGSMVGRLGDFVHDSYQRANPRDVPLEEFPVRIVYVDDASLAKHGPWPWPRNKLAELAQTLFDRGAAVVGFDIVFAEPDRFGAGNLVKIHPGLSENVRAELKGTANLDTIFANVLGAPEHYTVLGRVGEVVDGPAPEINMDLVPIFTEFGGGFPEGLLTYNALIPGIPDLYEVSLGHGLLNGKPDPDGVIRRVPLVANVAGHLMPSFALEMIRVAAQYEIELSGGRVTGNHIELDMSGTQLRRVRIGSIVAPVQPDGRMRVYFSHPVKGRYTSALSVLDGSNAQDDPDYFKRKLVIVGLGTVGGEDVVSTPVISESFGPDVHAQVIESLFAGEVLDRPSYAPAVEWILGIILGICAALGLPRMLPRNALLITIAGAVALFAVSYGLFHFFLVVADATLPVFAAGIPALVTLAGVLVNKERSLIERKARAEQARRVQQSMLPSRRSLRDLPESVDVWPVLMSAQEVAGDLYDLFMLDDRRLYFMVGDVTGKGVAAALFMSVAKSLSKSVILRSGKDFGAAVAEMNLEISRDNPGGTLVTGVFGVLDLKAGRVTMCNAGHENPVVIRADGETFEYTMEGGPPFCVRESYPYPLETLDLSPGDTIVLITDGVTEAKGPDGSLFGRARVVDVLAASPLEGDAKEITSHLVREVWSFEAGGTPADDLTVMAIRYNG